MNESEEEGIVSMSFHNRVSDVYRVVLKILGALFGLAVLWKILMCG